MASSDAPSPGADPSARFLSTLSHDLRGACHGIMLSMDLLRRDLEAGRSGDELREDLELATQAVIDASVRMERLITAERFRSGTMPVRPQEADVIPPLRRAAEQALACVPEAAGRLTVELPPSLRATTDPRLAAEAVGGLVDHALRQSPGEEGAIRLEGHPAGRGLRLVAPAPWLSVEARRLLAGVGDPPDFDAPELGLYVAGRCAAAAGIELELEPPPAAGQEALRIRFLAPGGQAPAGSPIRAG